MDLRCFLRCWWMKATNIPGGLITPAVRRCSLIDQLLYCLIVGIEASNMFQRLRSWATANIMLGNTHQCRALERLVWISAPHMGKISECWLLNQEAFDYSILIGWARVVWVICDWFLSWSGFWKFCWFIMSVYKYLGAYGAETDPLFTNTIDLVLPLGR